MAWSTTLAQPVGSSLSSLELEDNGGKRTEGGKVEVAVVLPSLLPVTGKQAVNGSSGGFSCSGA